MTQDDLLYRLRLRVFAIASELGNVAQLRFVAQGGKRLRDQQGVGPETLEPPAHRSTDAIGHQLFYRR